MSITDRKCPADATQLPLRTRSLVLRHFVPEDARAVFLLSREETLRAWLPSQVYRDESHAASVLAFLISRYSSPGDPRHGPYVLAVEHGADRVLIGHVGFSPVDEDVEIGFAIAEGYKGRGLATEAIEAATRWAFATFHLGRIVGITATANTASRRALLRAGFELQADKEMNFQGVEQTVNVYALRPRHR